MHFNTASAGKEIIIQPACRQPGTFDALSMIVGLHYFLKTFA
jgi:hypothetical protein